MGLTVGLSVGSKVGDTVGLEVGLKVGLEVGLMVGGAVGVGIGGTVGSVGATSPVGLRVFFGFLVLGLRDFLGLRVFFGLRVFLGFRVFFNNRLTDSKSDADATLPLRRVDSLATAMVATKAASKRVKRKVFMVVVQCEFSFWTSVEPVFDSDEGKIVRLV